MRKLRKLINNLPKEYQKDFNRYVNDFLALGDEPDRTTLLNGWELINRNLARYLSDKWECDVEEIHTGLYDFADIILTNDEMIICIKNDVDFDTILKYSDYRIMTENPFNLNNYIKYVM